MEESENTTTTQSSGSISFVQIALATIALALGGAALFLAINSAKKSAAINDEITEKIERVAAAAIEVKKVSDRVDSLATMLEDNKSAEKLRTDNFARQVQSVLENLSANIKSNRELIEANQKAIQEVAQRGGKSVRKSEQPKASENAEAQKPQEGAQNAQEAQTASADGATVHVVESGDTFSKIARKYKVSIESIEKANPGVSSSKLKIGQKINIAK